MEILTLPVNARRKQGLTLGVRMIKLEQTQGDASEISARQRATATAAWWFEHAVTSGAMRFAASVKAGGFKLIPNRHEPQSK